MFTDLAVLHLSVTTRRWKHAKKNQACKFGTVTKISQIWRKMNSQLLQMSMKFAKFADSIEKIVQKISFSCFDAICGGLQLITFEFWQSHSNISELLSFFLEAWYFSDSTNVTDFLFNHEYCVQQIILDGRFKCVFCFEFLILITNSYITVISLEIAYFEGWNCTVVYV